MMKPIEIIRLIVRYGLLTNISETSFDSTLIQDNVRFKSGHYMFGGLNIYLIDPAGKMQDLHVYHYDDFSGHQKKDPLSFIVRGPWEKKIIDMLKRFEEEIKKHEVELVENRRVQEAKAKDLQQKSVEYFKNLLDRG